MGFQINAAGESNIGPRKPVNQDSYFFAVAQDEIPAGIFMVADGVSGSSHGEIASKMCADSIKAWWDKEFPIMASDAKKAVSSLAETIHLLNQRVCSHLLENGGRSASTMTLLFILQDEWFVFNSGDSRTYKLESGLFHRLEQLTEDQSTLVEREYSGRKILKSVLTSCIGGRGHFEYGYSCGRFRRGDRFLLCSDGVNKTLSDPDIAKILRRGEPAAVCGTLIRTALRNGETDNITALVVSIDRREP